MSFGFQLIGDSSNYQVDDTYANYVMTSKGTGTLTTDNMYPQAIVSCSITVSGVAPMIAYSCSSRMVQLYVQNSGSTWTFFMTSKTATNGSTFNYYIFDKADQDSVSGGYGIEVFNSSGVRTFHSSNKVLRIAGIGGGTYTSGRTYAAIQFVQGMSYNETDISGVGSLYRINLSYTGASISSNVVSVAANIYVNYTTTTITGNTYSNSSGSVFGVIDVTNY